MKSREVQRVSFLSIENLNHSKTIPILPVFKKRLKEFCNLNNLSSNEMFDTITVGNDNFLQLNSEGE
jgi:hypothetical protein